MNSGQVAAVATLLAVLLGLIPAVIAKNKGRDFFVWWVFGAMLFIVALPVALLMKPHWDAYDQRAAAAERKAADAGLKKCPDCAEMVRAEARKCRFCGHQFDS